MLPTTRTFRLFKRQRSNIIIYVLFIIGCLALYRGVNESNKLKVKQASKRKLEKTDKKYLPKLIEGVKSILDTQPPPIQNIEISPFTKDDMLDEHGNPYRIILWTNGHGEPGYKANPEECLDKISCKITYDRREPEKAHAIVFQFDNINRNNLPPKRQPFQLYVWWALESPKHAYIALQSENFFNLTFHYRTDADVYAPYGSINLILRELKAAGETDLEALLEKKRSSGKVAAWAVSNCYDKRLKFGKSLMSLGLNVDTFGQCFGNKEIGGGRYSDSFYKKLSEYKFYFSFENSVGCKDYITEKFWFNGLRSGAVPIVWGPRKEDVLKVAPTKSFIHTDDFETKRELVDYLQYLSNNETAYAEYLQWRTWNDHPERIEERLWMKNRDNDLRSFCKLCSILQTDGKKRKLKLPVKTRIINSLNNAWQGPEERCHV